MTVKILRRGSKGTDVKRWQTFLVGQNHLHSTVDGDFGVKTENATKAFQRAHGLGSDGIVGSMTLGTALTLGFDIGFSDPQRGDGEELLPGKSPLKAATSTSARERMFGKFNFKPAPTRSNPEGIKILGNWEAENIETVFLPQLKGKMVFGRSSSGKMRFHKAAAQQLKDMWAAWEEAGVIDCVSPTRAATTRDLSAEAAAS